MCHTVGMAVKKGWHCAYDVHYHLVFPVKYRKALIRPEIEAELVRISGEIAARYDIEFEQMGEDRDHIHLLCRAHPSAVRGRSSASSRASRRASCSARSRS